MKALLFNNTGDLSNLEYTDIPQPGKPGANEIKIKFLAGSLNHLDLWVLKGLPRHKYNFPQIAGSDLCGEVIECSSNKFKAGDRVIVYPAASKGLDNNGKPCPENLCPDFRVRGESMPGVFAEEIVVEERFVFKAPEHLSNSQAACIPLTYVTAWQMVTEKAEIMPNQFDSEIPIIVHGVGSGVSQAILEILIHFGAKNVAATSRSENKLEPWTERGIKAVKADKDSIKSWCGPDRVAVIFDHIGKHYLDLNMKMLKRGGKLVTCGATSGYDAQIDLRYLFFNQLALLGSTMGSLKHFSEMVDWVKKSRMSPTIHHEFPLKEGAKAYALMDSGQQNGKIALIS